MGKWGRAWEEKRSEVDYRGERPKKGREKRREKEWRGEEKRRGKMRQ